MYDGRRSRARRAAPPPQPQPATRSEPPRGGARTVNFNIPLQCQGTLTLFDYRSEATQIARVEFQCAVPGVLHVYVDGVEVLTGKTYPGKVLASGIFMPVGSFVQVHFTNAYDTTSRLTGTITIGPAPEDEALKTARSFFGLPGAYTPEELTRTYKRLVMRYHPDHGGDHARMVELNHHYELLKARIG